jgi:hypothetical protein
MTTSNADPPRPDRRNFVRGLVVTSWRSRGQSILYLFWWMVIATALATALLLTLIHTA